MDQSESVVVSGGFDPLHVGHVKMFQEAAKLASKLIVIVNNDDFLMLKKGYVFMPIDERMEIIKNISVVDKVVKAIDTDLTVCQTLNLLAKEENIIVFANGGDRQSKKDILESTVCKDNQIEMKFNIGGGKIQSSSSLVSTTVNKPWGSYKTFEKDKDYLVICDKNAKIIKLLYIDKYLKVNVVKNFNKYNWRFDDFEKRSLGNFHINYIQKKAI
mgnify:CR=1 FL=1